MKDIKYFKYLSSVFNSRPFNCSFHELSDKDACGVSDLFYSWYFVLNCYANFSDLSQKYTDGYTFVNFSWNLAHSPRYCFGPYPITD